MVARTPHCSLIRRRRYDQALGAYMSAGLAGFRTHSASRLTPCTAPPSVLARLQRVGCWSPTLLAGTLGPRSKERWRNKGATRNIDPSLVSTHVKKMEPGGAQEGEVDVSTGTVHVDGVQWGDGGERKNRQHSSGDSLPQQESAGEVQSRAPRRFVGRRRAEERRAGADSGGDGALVAASGTRTRSRVVNAVPDDILKNPALNEMIAKQLPPNYSFEVHKTIWRLREANAKTVALQLPEGLQMFACALADIIGEFAQVEVVVLGDVTYGACCVDDLTARALGADMLVHYGHSCLVPIDTCCIKTMYVFVEISVDLDHLLAALKHNFDPDKRLLLVGTVQFVGSIHKIRPALEQHFASVSIPQSRPLSKGEVLGCTAPTIDASQVDLVIYVGDGRFHLEAIMIANPSLPYYRYDPYSKVMSAEGYAHDQLYHNRQKAIDACSGATVFGVIQVLAVYPLPSYPPESHQSTRTVRYLVQWPKGSRRGSAWATNSALRARRNRSKGAISCPDAEFPLCLLLAVHARARNPAGHSGATGKPARGGTGDVAYPRGWQGLRAHPSLRNHPSKAGCLPGWSCPAPPRDVCTF